ncbi:aromatic ring-hydroxylating oxygenase subunit alpha [Nitrincola nitratireducens]|uniref:Anthranilate 1,2-dioxygenase large subunit n=1 Tax=Nitrincola nitratireducens TaxID=1229521 RepID=W9VLP0_9GAMM|nr:aromatic ring-hydroxylating dioxygenase subunit alpha [Nitrincola nitratireducens]EXJ11445.1 Anthranilate 1,2-dioxygenase large subunit [Nitrincola nitratireducens]
MNQVLTPMLEDPLSGVSEKAASMLANRKPNYSLEQPFYNDERIFKLDIREIFEKEWIFAGMTCEIPKKGNFITLNIGDNPIVLVRGAEDKVHGFFNVCRHRGSRLCVTEKGKVAKLVCPYHKWTYELDGRLIFAGSDMGESFDLNAHSLKPVNVKVAGGYIFVCLAETPPDIEEFTQSLEHYLEPYDTENLKVAVQSDIVEDCNWKLVIENNRECYHCNGSHPELLNSLQQFDDTDDPLATPEYKDLVARKQKDWDDMRVPYTLKYFGKRNRMTRTPLLDGVVSMTMDGKPACSKLMGRITSPDMGSLRILHLPNSWNHWQGDHTIVFRVLPLGPQKTLVTTKWLVHKDAVEGVDYDPENMRKVWDATNYQDKVLAEENQRGINSIAYQPGPYSETFEFGVIDFVNWYSERIIENTRKS